MRPPRSSRAPRRQAERRPNRKGAERRRPRGAKERQAQRHSRPWRQRLQAYGLNHARTLISSLGQLLRNPAASLMTCAVIGIALALPLGIFVALNNLEQVSGAWDGRPQLSLFTQMDVSDAQARRLAQALGAWPEIDRVETLERSAALEEFRRLSGYGEALSLLPDNPLPAVLLIRPAAALDTPAEVAALAQRLRQQTQADQVLVDLEWVQRLHLLMATGQRVTLVLAVVLLIAVLLIVGNTIRLDIQNRREEIEIIKLVGATNGFIRRPYLYAGFWYGWFGAILAWLLVETSLGVVAQPIAQLAGSYGSDFQLRSLDLTMIGALWAAGAGLGWGGSWLALRRHLRAIEPQ